MENKIKFGSGNYDYIVTEERMLGMQVCSNCAPDDMDKLEDAVKRIQPAGTTGNWQILKDGVLMPVKCADIPGRWHYLFMC